MSPAVLRFARRALPWVCMIAGIWWLSGSGAPSAAFPAGATLPELALDLSDGTRLALPGQTGSRPPRVLVLNFWASYCAPCRDEAPILSALHARNPAEVQVIGLSIEGLPRAHMLRAAQELGMRYPLGACDPPLISLLRLREVPTTYVIAKDGVITLSRVGTVTQSELEAAIDTAKRRG